MTIRVVVQRASKLLKISTPIIFAAVLAACGAVGRTDSSSSSGGSLDGIDTPSITRLSPNPVSPGGPEFVLSVYGSNLSSTESKVQFNGQERPTGLTCIGVQCLSEPPHIDARIGSDDIRTAGTAIITVVNTGGKTSNGLTLTIASTPPAQCIVCITEMIPDSIVAGSQGFTLTINGSGFQPGMTVLWDDLNNPTADFKRPTTYVSYNQLTAAIPSSDLKIPGSVYVSVIDPMFPVSSRVEMFTIQSPF